jgi:hypothetical protein
MRRSKLNMTRRALAALLAALLAGPPVGLQAEPSQGRVQGTVTLEGRPLSGVDVALVDLDSGSIYRTRSTESGAFQLRVAPGQYSVAAESRAGLAVGRAPALLPVRAGQLASAAIELLSIPYLPQEAGLTPADLPPAEGGPLSISHEAVGCMIAGEFPLIDARVEPAANVARVRLMFKGAQSTEYFFVEFGALEGMFVAKMPKPTAAASPVSYYIQAVSTDGIEVQSPEVNSDVVESADQCPPDTKVAAVGPAGEVTVFSAATGSAVKPIGFAAGGALTVGAIALIIAGLAGVATAIAIINPSPTPTATPTSTPTPPPPTTTLPPVVPTPTPPGPTPTPPGSPFKF